MDASAAKAVAGATNAWLVAACRQANRVLDGTLDDGQGIEFMLYATALNNASRGATAILGKGSKQVQTFNRKFSDAKDVRDMLEHFDKYLAGDGYLQSPPTDDGLRTPWLAIESGSASFSEGETEYGIMILTKVGPEREQRSFHLDVRASLNACADLVEAALDAAGVASSSAAVAEARAV